MREKLISAINQMIYGGVAQLGEHLPCKQGVMGSNPIISTRRSEASQLKMENGKWKMELDSSI